VKSRGWRAQETTDQVYPAVLRITKKPTFATSIAREFDRERAQPHLSFLIDVQSVRIRYDHDPARSATFRSSDGILVGSAHRSDSMRGNYTVF
jgi:hypothetical protein